MMPKVFISYSRTSQTHQELVIEWAERLISDGVDVVMDVYDLKEGQDKFAFMERMVTDPEVTHALLICDSSYAEKADARKRGVGTESQIISQEIYEKVEQTKFIPIVCEFRDEETPFLPVFLKSRIWIDFSSPEAVNHHWERLIRILFNKPLYEKPKLGKTPTYITDGTSAPASPAHAKYQTLRQAILQGKKGLRLYRKDFLDSCFEYADQLRVRERPDVENLGNKILEDCGKLVQVRDHIIDWVLLESEADPSEDFSETLIEVLERLRELKARPTEVTSWSDAWFDAHKLFVYETFLYIIAALLKSRAFEVLHNVFASHYMIPATENYGEGKFTRFHDFWAYSDILNPVLAPEGQRLYSPAAELIRRQAQRPDLPFREIIQAELLVLLMALITPNARWYPQTLHYASFSGSFPFFLRASQHKNFEKLATVTGIKDVEELKKAVQAGHERLKVNEWHNFHCNPNFWHSMNMDALDTLK